MRTRYSVSAQPDAPAIETADGKDQPDAAEKEESLQDVGPGDRPHAADEDVDHRDDGKDGGPEFKGANHFFVVVFRFSFRNKIIRNIRYVCQNIKKFFFCLV